VTCDHVYVHVPFCARRCSYCDFAIAVRREVPVSDFVAGLHAELRTRVPERQTTPIETVYLGGGTPSRLGVDGVPRVLDVVRGRFDLAPRAEVTVEANPEDVEPAATRAWQAAGVTRVSLGVQSFDDSVLTWMHRTHDVAMVDRAAEVLATAGIEDWSLDLIYALPPEVPRDWAADLDRAIALAPPHVAAYGLSVEQGTPLARWRDRGAVRDADEESYEREFLLADSRLAAAGYEHYEVSNYARPGRRARHNSAYWRGVPYLGLGPSAHGFDGARRRWNEREYTRWQSRAVAGEDPEAGSELLSSEQRYLEDVYVGLRTARGFPVDDLDREEVEKWVGAGWGTIREGRVVLTPAGWLRLDALVSSLTKDRSRY
jgi:putative oxygen-independent coproporphyrinogen III oxidase